MITLVLGATGATRRLLVQQLLDREQQFRAVVRSLDKIPEAVREHPNLSLIEASILDLGDEEIAELVQDCDAVASCLGHNMTFKGMFGSPRRLVTDATRRSCEAIMATTSEKPIKFVL